MKCAGLALALFATTCVVPGFAADGDDANMTTVLALPEQAIEGGHWKYEVRRGTARSCDGKSDEQQCIDQDVMIDNQSAHTLECDLHVDYKLSEGRVVADFDTPALVYPRSRLRAHRQITDPQATAEVTRLNCKSRAPYQRVPKIEGCTYEMAGPKLDDYYPPYAIRLSLEGPVIVAFTIPKESGKADHAVVAESSLVPQLDSAALMFVAAQSFTTTCPGTRFDMRIRFRLNTLVSSGREVRPPVNPRR